MAGPLGWGTPLRAQAPAQSGLQSPESYLGYSLGERFTRHHAIEAYARHVAQAAPDRTRLLEYGRTYEQRPLLVLAFASPANLARLPEIMANNQRLAGLAPGAPRTDGAPAIVWLSFNIHGNEPASSEAALHLLHQLANPADTAAARWLERLVVLVDPCLNPDGRDRYVNWFHNASGAASPLGPQPNPQAYEHNEPWPSGRPNHYMFDLNRDWAWQTQAESRQRAELYQQWLPHVHSDFHEMSAQEPYFFPPPAEPRHEDIAPHQAEFLELVGQLNASEFERRNWLYYTRESYDLLYPSYGDSWPTFQGAAGMTFEKGGIRAGLAMALESGDTLTLRLRATQHLAAARQTLNAAWQRAPQLVADFARYHTRGAQAPPGPYRSYLIKAAGMEDNVRALRLLLDRHRIRYGIARGQRRTLTGYSYRSGKTEFAAVEAGDLVINAAQPRAVLVKVLLEPRTALPDSFTYDLTAWALPYAYNLRAYALTDQLLGQVADAAPASAEAAVPTPPSGGRRPAAWFIEYNGFNDARLLAEALRRKLRVRVADRPFKLKGRTWAPGTLIFTAADHASLGAGLDTLIPALAARHHERAEPAGTGLMEGGPDFGSDYVRLLRPPRIASLTGPGTAPNGAGEVWHFFEQQLGYPLTLLPADALGRAQLADFDVLILPNGDYNRLMTNETRQRLLDWVRAGGRLVALEGALEALAGKPGLELATRQDSARPATRPDPARTYGERQRRSLTDELQGAVYRLRLDASHPLAYGYGKDYTTLRLSGSQYGLLKTGWNVATLDREGYLAGFVGARLRSRMTESLIFGVEDLGAGRVVYMADSPLFRGFWHGGKLLFANAALLLQGRR